MTWRKWLLDLTRIQADPTINSVLTSTFNNLEPTEVVVDNPTEALFILSKHTVRDFTLDIFDSELACSILSYYVRAETTAFIHEFLQVYDETVTKETKAALFFEPHTSQLDYNSLFGDATTPLSDYTTVDRQRRVVHLLQQGLNSLKASYSSTTAPIIFPTYNRRKNIGFGSQELLHRALFDEQHMDIDQRSDYTTLDLLRHYHDTGNRIGGALEVRVAWKYGDLKPRVYYCTGGDSFWSSTFVKPIVDRLLRILPSTDPSTRYSVERLGPVGSDQLLVTYDYTSFTTSLSELKFFLHHLATMLVGTTVRCLDVREGVIEVDVGEYLHVYNEHVNIHQEIDLRRIIDPKDHSETIFRQGRNGSLGVQGNIGFSMLLHGISLGSFSSTPDNDSDVGDDALTILFENLLHLFIEHTNLLGTIHPEKFSTMRLPPVSNPNLAVEQAFKYLKRPITVDFTGKIQTGVLEFFPSVADFLFPDGDGIHSSVMNTDPISMVRSLCMQWGRYLYLHHHSESIDRTHETDLGLIVDTIGLCYDMVGLPKTGGLPGTPFYPVSRDIEEEAKFFIPACDSITVFTVDWVEALYALHHGVRIVSPVRSGGTICMDPFATNGTRMRVSDGDQLFPLLYDLGYLDKEPVLEELEFDNAYVRRLEEIMLGRGGETVYDVVVLKDLPDWYFPVASENWYSLEVVDIAGKLEEIQSLTSFSV